MNLQINSDRNHFYQWDTGQLLIVEGADTCEEVHFSRRNDPTALVCEIREKDDVRVVEVPNILLQSDEQIIAYLVSRAADGAETSFAKSFRVQRRPKPEDYIYTETEVRTYMTLERRIADLENAKADAEAIASGIKAYMDENPVTPEGIGALPADRLSEAVNSALAQAKASGDFKGDKGDPGSDANVTKENVVEALGYTPVNKSLHPVTPQDYGAKGDGYTDDTAAFQNALSENRVVFVPGGSYILSGELIIENNCQLELSQDTVLYFTQTAGNCVSLKYCSWLNGNHATVSVPYGFTGNVVNIDTAYSESATDTPPFKEWDPMWKPNRFITNLNIVKPDTRGFYYSMDGSCNGTALFIKCDGNDTSTFLWGLEFTGLRIAGAFAYGVHGVVSNMEGDSGWNHEMKVDGIIAACETGVKLENVNNVYLSVIVQPIKAMDANDVRFPYAKYGIYLDNCKQADMSGSRVWDWDSDKTLWSEGSEYQHLVMIGNCMGAILNEFGYYGNPSYDIRSLIHTDTPSNLEKMTILQEPFTRWFKPKDHSPYFFDGDFEKRLVLKEELDEFVQAERTANFTNAIPTAINKDGTVFNEVGYTKYGMRWNASDGVLITDDAYHGCTGLIPIQAGDIIYAKALYFGDSSDAYQNAVVFDSSFNRVISGTVSTIPTMSYYFDYTQTDEGFTLLVKQPSTAAYITFSFKRALIGDNPIISVNNPITYSQSGYLADGIKVKGENVEGLGGGSSVAQSDWNAAEGESGHVLNRPFYSEEGLVELLPETAFTATEETGYIVGLPDALNLTDGAEYVVKYNGTEYTCTAFVPTGEDVAVSVMLGNGAVAGLDDTGEPFAIAVYIPEMAAELGMDIIAIPLDGSTEFTMSISKMGEVVTPIPSKYLPPPVFLYTDGTYLYKTEDTSNSENLLIKSELQELVDSCKKIYVTGENTSGAIWYLLPIMVAFDEYGGHIIVYSNHTGSKMDIGVVSAPITRTIA